MDKFIINIVDIINIREYNRGIITERTNMTPQELKQLEEEHRKAMEAINAFNKEAKCAIKTGKEMMGI